MRIPLRILLASGLALCVGMSVRAQDSLDTGGGSSDTLLTEAPGDTVEVAEEVLADTMEVVEEVLVDTAEVIEEVSVVLPRVSLEVAVEGDKNRVTKLGRMVIELYPDEAPLHVADFLKMVEAGEYEGVAFHRIVPGFIIQGGDPDSRADWKSPRLGLEEGDCSLPPEVGRHHTRGAVAAARRPDEVNPEQETSCYQFYICLADLPGLDRGSHSVFGQVVEGMEVVEKIARVKNAGSANMNRALQRVYMTEVHLVQ